MRRESTVVIGGISELKLVKGGQRWGCGNSFGEAVWGCSTKICVMSVAGSGSNGRACQWNKCWSGSNFFSGSLMLGNASNQYLADNPWICTALKVCPLPFRLQQCLVQLFKHGSWCLMSACKSCMAHPAACLWTSSTQSLQLMSWWYRGPIQNCRIPALL